jgi:hypothetical protein
MTRDELQRVRDWADRELTMGVGSPWARCHYMKLREAADAILFPMDSNYPVRVAPDSQQRAPRRGRGHLQLVDNAQPDLESADLYVCPCDVEPSS